MTWAREVSDRTARDRRRWLVKRAAFETIPAVALSIGVVLAPALGDTELIATRMGQRSVDLGWPFVWIHQDQSSLDQPLPYRFGLSSPWEHPTVVSAVAFTGNVVIVFASVLTSRCSSALSSSPLLDCSRRCARRPRLHCRRSREGETLT